MENKRNNLLVSFLLSLTLGLAPFFPEPHIVGKLRWVMGGAVGMQPLDWFDFLQHGAPWVWFLYEVFKKYLSPNFKRKV